MTHGSTLDTTAPHPAPTFATLSQVFGSAAPFFEIVETSPAAIWVLRPDLTALYVNRTCLRYGGIDAAASLDMGWSVILHPADRDACFSALRECVRERQPTTHECRAQRANDSCGWVRIHAVPWSAPGADEVTALVVTGTDITRHRHGLAEQSVTAERLRLAVDGSSDGVWDWPDVNRPVMWWSSRCYAICGYEPGDVEPNLENFIALVHPQDAPGVKQRLQYAITTTTPYDSELRIRRKDGGYRWCRGRAEISRTGTVVRMSGSLQDIHAAKEAAAEISALQERYRRAEAGSTNGLWEWDLNSDRMWYSDNFKALLGRNKLEALASTQRSLAALLHVEDKVRVEAAIAANLSEKIPLDVEFRMTTHDGEVRWFRSRAMSQRVENGRVIRLSGSLYDVHELKLAQIALHDEQDKLQTTLSSLGEPVVTTDAAGKIEFVNQAAENFLGIAANAVLGRSFDEVFEIRSHGLHEVMESPVRQCLAVNCDYTGGEGLLRLGSHAELAVEFTARKIRSATDRTYGVVLLIRDVTEKRQQAEIILHRASHDALTGLVNRYEFERRLARVIAQPLNEPDAHAMLFLDLDRFKAVNDTCGHAGGDELLRQVAVLLKAELRRRDTVARFGGDEFAILMEYCNLQQAERVAQAIRERLANFRFPWHTGHFSIGVSVGLLMIGTNVDSLATVLCDADAACYMAKKLGRNRVHVFDPREALAIGQNFQ